MVAGKGSGAKGQQPEALNTFHAAARSGSVKPKEQGFTAQSRHCPEGEGSLEEE